MKVLVVGFHSFYDLVAVCTQVLTSLGQETRLFYTNRRGNLLVRLSRRVVRPFIQGRPLSFYQRSKEEMNDRLVKTTTAFRPDLLFVIKGDDIFPQTLQRLKALGGLRLVNWAVDDPFSPSYPDIAPGIPYYDGFFIPDRSYELRLKQGGAREVKFLPFACNPAVHRTISLTSGERRRFGSAVCFVGTVHRSRIDVLGSLIGLDLAIWGEPFQDPEATVLQAKYRGRAGQKQLAKIYNASRIALNPHHPQAVEGTNMRTFEAAACGIFQLTDRKRYLEETFAFGEEIVCYEDPREVAGLVRYYLSHEEERRSIALRMQEKVLREHTYRHRMQQVLQEETK